MMQSKATVLKLHGGSSDDTSSQEKKKKEKKLTKIQDVKTLLASLIKTRCFQLSNYFSASSIFFFLLLTNDPSS